MLFVCLVKILLLHLWRNKQLREKGVIMSKADNLLKIKASLLYIISKFKKEIDYIKLFKLLYLAQKEHLKKYGRPIVNDDFYAMKAGPVPTITYDICKVADKEITDMDLSDIAQSISVVNRKNSSGTPIKCVKANAIADMDELSVSDIECIDYACKTYGRHHSTTLSDISHDEAWKKSWEPHQVPTKMNLLDIAKSANVSDSMLAYIQEYSILNGIQC